ncbi:Potassium channel protein [Sphingomonas antarctica]|uniref:ion channel n=1 Tax=Sphingomonas antarctica TaxID=2040274 RepID=UPI0039E733F4
MNRRHEISLAGVPAIRIGGPSRFSDLYYAVMEMSWPQFIAVTAALFVAINLGFGLIYTMMPGAIAHMEPGSLVDGFFFSVDTLGTVGYGAMHPADHLGHAVAAIEILVGLFFSATITGLIFARFSRPRESLEFSQSAVIGQFDGKPALMIRVAVKRTQPLADAHGQISWLETVVQPDGRTLRRMTPLPLVRDVNPLFGLTWTLVHMLDEDSPVLAGLESSERFMVAASVAGTDTLLATQAQGSRRYLREDILRDREFVDVLHEEDGTMHFTWDLLHKTFPTPKPE